MISEIDVWGTALLMLERFGAEARIQAAMRANESLIAGDADGNLTWEAVVRALEQLLAGAPGPSLRPH